MKSLTVVVPCFNEEAVLQETSLRLVAVLEGLIERGKIAATSHVIYVDDGSRDRTWQIIEAQSASDSMIHGVKLSRNRGHQNAVIAGLFSASGDLVVSVDADLQDDLGAIEAMVDENANGAEIVYGVRKGRDADSWFKRVSAEGYYRLLSLMGVEAIFNHADYRLMSRRAIDALREYGEVNVFLRGIIPQLGFKTASVFYDRAERFAGESKYPLKKMIALAWQGVTSFSIVPLRFVTSIGLLVSVGSLGVGMWSLGVRIFTNLALPGWTSTVLPIYILGGIQLFCMGIIGEYVAKIYMETKRRPRYIIEKSV